MKIRSCFSQLGRVQAYITEERITVRLRKNFLTPGKLEMFLLWRSLSKGKTTTLRWFSCRLLEVVKITKWCVSSDLCPNLIDVGENNCFGVDCRYKSGRHRSGLISFSYSFNFLLPWTIIIVNIKKFLLSFRCTWSMPAHYQWKSIISILLNV